jgi:D-glycero-D-manno-heptose 1,7-bisphosphate phosphatase
MTRPAVFLDRDGTIIEERGYIDRLDLVTLFPWTADALRLLKRAGFATVVVTNQSAIGRGIIDEAFLHSVHQEIDRRLAPAGAAIDRYYYCPHFVDSARKLEPFVTNCVQ